MSLRVVTVLPGLLFVAAAWAQEPTGSIPVGSFSEGTLTDWQSRAFKGETIYELVDDPELGVTVLAATAEGTASGRFKTLKVDLTATPFLNWSWKVTETFPDIDESSKAGDDFPARVYVVIERGVLGMNSLALNYVWASQHPAGSLWSSPYMTQVRLLALDSGSEGLGTWVHHKRNLRNDLQAAFGEDISMIDAVAIMTDADDHNGQATTYYGDIWLSAE